MVFLNKAYRHFEWRKLAKKQRRKRIRQALAKKRDADIAKEQEKLESQPEYQEWVRQQERNEQLKEEEEERQRLLMEEKWKKAEEEAQKHWQELQKKLALAREEKMKQNMKIKLEWEREQKRLKEIQEAKEKEQERKRIEQVEQEKLLLDFLEQGGDTPEHLKQKLESNPGKEACPFFQKVAACRFFDACSRNHIRPGISRTLLITNFFSHISLEVKENEHGSDSSLEFEREDTYKQYREFFLDVVMELERFGRVEKFLTCCNHESHLRGNVYVQFRTTREALISYHKLNGRWYGGKQLNVQFCSVKNWNDAICGLFSRKKCPKGNSCNFLHVFRNPKGLYTHVKHEESQRSQRYDRNSSKRKRLEADDDKGWEDDDHSERRSWRWSESPEFDRNDTYHHGNKKRTHTDHSRSKRSRSRSRIHREKIRK